MGETPEQWREIAFSQKRIELGAFALGVTAGLRWAKENPMSEITEKEIDEALSAMNGGMIDARRPFHKSDRSLMRAALSAVLASRIAKATQKTENANL